MTKLYTMESSLCSESDFNMLSRERQKKAERFIFEKDRKLSIAASMLIAEGLREYGIDEKDVIYSYGKYGKPYFRDYPYIHFNISHSASISCAVFSENEVGCDIEIIRDYDNDIALECFTLKERESIIASSDSALAFTRLWCIKESFLKALGVGLECNMRRINVTINDKGIFIEQNIDRRKWKINTYMMYNHFISIFEEDF